MSDRHDAILFDGPAAGKIVSVHRGVSTFMVEDHGSGGLGLARFSPVGVTSQVKRYAYHLELVVVGGMRYFVGHCGDLPDTGEMADMIRQSTLKPDGYY